MTIPSDQAHWRGPIFGPVGAIGPGQLDGVSRFRMQSGQELLLGTWLLFDFVDGSQMRVGNFDQSLIRTAITEAPRRRADEVSSGDPVRFVAHESLSFIVDVSVPGSAAGPANELNKDLLARVNRHIRQTVHELPDWPQTNRQFNDRILPVRTNTFARWRVELGAVGTSLAAIVAPAATFQPDLRFILLPQPSGPIDLVALARKLRSWRHTQMRPLPEHAALDRDYENLPPHP